MVIDLLVVVHLQHHQIMVKYVVEGVVGMHLQEKLLLVSVMVLYFLYFLNLICYIDFLIFILFLIFIFLYFEKKKKYTQALVINKCL